VAGDPVGGRLARLAGLQLLPYHLGRALGYGSLGAAAGGAVGLASLGISRGLLAVPLALAALLMFVQAVASLPLPVSLRFHLPMPALPALAGRLLRTPSGPRGGILRGFLLGFALSALPCGMLYAALAAAAASGSALAGALAMLSFVVGTVPALAGVAVLGRFFGRRYGRGMRLVGGIALLVNGAVLTGLALRVMGA
jgi:sulfite exporter TauE/SafE